MTKRNREENLEFALRTLITLLVVAVLVIISVFTISHYLELHYARVCLFDAKAVRLASITVSNERYGSGTAFSDDTTEDGLAEGAAEAISRVSQCSGKIRLLRAGDGGYGMREFTYTEGEYTAVYARTESGTDSWQVYRRTILISP